MIINILLLGKPTQLYRLLINVALQHSYNVTALLSKPDELMISHPDLEVIKGESENYDDMESAIAGQDAVIWAFEEKNGSAICIGTQNMILGMQEMKVRRLVCLSSIGAGSSSEKMGAAFQLITFLKGNKLQLEAKGEQEKMLASSKLDFIIVQVPALQNDCHRDARITAIRSDKIEKKVFRYPGRVCRAIVVQFIISQLECDHWLGQTVSLFSERKVFNKPR